MNFTLTNKFGMPPKADSAIQYTKQALAAQLQSCSSHPTQLKQIHGIVLTTGLSIKNSLITQLLTNLTQLGDMVYARQLFDEMHKPRIFLWNTLVKGYVKNVCFVEAALVYRKMHHLGIRPDSFTFPFVVKACSEFQEMRVSEGIHAHVVKYGLEFVAMVRTELILMYVKFGELGLADYLFGNMVERDLIAWNALITACVQNGHASKALSLFRQMSVSGVKPDSVTVVSTFSACGQLGCLKTGEDIYGMARKEGINCNIIVDNARLDMYLKCGSADIARTLFEEMPHRNVISWSTMILGYAINGESRKALALFTQMRNEGLHPNHVTYLGVLLACSHAGLVNEGQDIFNRMARSNDKIIQPRKEHYACMVDLLGRSGYLEEAYNFIQTMPIEADPGVWGALLGACAIHQNVKLGQHAADSLLELAPDVGSYHVLLSNMYAAAGRWDRVQSVRRRMKKKGVKKVVSYSSIEFNGKIYFFKVGEKSQSYPASIYEKLDELSKKVKSLGYIPKTGSVFHDVELEEKEVAVSTHTEKLAIAFGILNVKPEDPVRVIKNLRICDDCHTFSKFVSQIIGRGIIMRDKSRFHHFQNGVCSCKDFW